MGALPDRGRGDRASHHPFATHSLRKGVKLPVVQAVLGHSTLVSTECYLHLLRETMCAEVEQHAL